MAIESGGEFKIVSHEQKALSQIMSALQAGLEMIGTQAEAYAKLALTDSTREGIDLVAQGERDNSRVSAHGGALRNSVTHVVQNNGAYIGSNLPYAVYNELGTGVHASQPGGRQGYWIYVAGSDGSHRSTHPKTYATLEEALKVVAIMRKKGLDAHATNGMYPLHFLRNAAANHIDEYKQIFKEIVGG